VVGGVAYMESRPSIDWPSAEQVDSRMRSYCADLKPSELAECNMGFTLGYIDEKEAGGQRTTSERNAGASQRPTMLGSRAYLAGAQYAAEASTAVH
jgi:hypothetical protein